MFVAALLRKWGLVKNGDDTAGKIQQPPFDTMLQFWTDLLAQRGLPQTVRWIFYEDYARLRNGFAFRLRPVAEADRIARFAYDCLDPKNRLVDGRSPLAMVAYAVTGDFVITGFAADVFTADEDVYRADWNIYFDAKNHLLEKFRIVWDERTWARVCAEQPYYLSELDYLVCIDALRRRFGYRD